MGLLASLSRLVLEASRGRNESEALGGPTEYYQQGRIVVVPTLGAPVKVGDVVWASNTRAMKIALVRIAIAVTIAAASGIAVFTPLPRASADECP